MECDINDFEHSCRLCLKHLGPGLQEERVSIFEADSICDTSIPMKIMTCVSIGVHAEEPFPRYICKDCQMQLDDFYLFKQVCSSADLELRKHYDPTLMLHRVKHSGIENAPDTHEHVPPQSSFSFMQRDMFSSTAIKTEPHSEDECGPTVAMELDTLSNNIDEEEVGASTSEPSATNEYMPIKILETFSVTSDNQRINEIEIKVEPLDVLIPGVDEFLQSDCDSTTSTVTAKESASLGSSSVTSRKDLTHRVLLNEDTPLSHYVDRQIMGVDNGSFIYNANDKQGSENNAMNTDRTIEHNKYKRLRKNYQCNKCNESFRRLSDLGVHKDSHLPTELKPFVCSVCPEKLSTKRFLDEHEQTHARATIFHCKECTMSCCTLPELKAHVRSHKCLLECVCGQRFATQTEYREHEKTHVAKPQKCTKESLRRENKIELQKTVNHQCQPPTVNCQKSCSILKLQDKPLIVHPQTSSAKNFRCNVCGIAFQTADTLIWHEAQHRNHPLLRVGLSPVIQMQSSDPQSQPFQCVPCKLGFPHKGALICHQAFYHRHEVNQNIVRQEAFTCQVCHVVFLNKNNYIIHKESHQYDRPRSTEAKKSAVLGKKRLLKSSTLSLPLLAPKK